MRHSASDKGLSPARCQAIIYTNAEVLSIGPIGTNFNEILIEIQSLSFKKRYLNMSSGKWRPFCLGLSVLINNAPLAKSMWLKLHAKLFAILYITTTWLFIFTLRYNVWPQRIYCNWNLTLQRPHKYYHKSIHGWLSEQTINMLVRFLKLSAWFVTHLCHTLVSVSIGRFFVVIKVIDACINKQKAKDDYNNNDWPITYIYIYSFMGHTGLCFAL